MYTCCSPPYTTEHEWLDGKEECDESSSSQLQDVHVQEEWLKDWRRIWCEEWITTITVVYGSRTWVVCLSDWRDIQVTMRGKIPVLLLSLLVSHTSLSLFDSLLGKWRRRRLRMMMMLDARQDKASDSFRSGFKKESRTERSKQTALKKEPKNQSWSCGSRTKQSSCSSCSKEREAREKARLGMRGIQGRAKKITVVDSSFSSSLSFPSSLFQSFLLFQSLYEPLSLSLVSLLLLSYSSLCFMFFHSGRFNFRSPTYPGPSMYTSCFWKSSSPLKKYIIL